MPTDPQHQAELRKFGKPSDLLRQGSQRSGASPATVTQIQGQANLGPIGEPEPPHSHCCPSRWAWGPGAPPPTPHTHTLSGLQRHSGSSGLCLCCLAPATVTSLAQREDAAPVLVKFRGSPWGAPRGTPKCREETETQRTGGTHITHPAPLVKPISRLSVSPAGQTDLEPGAPLPGCVPWAGHPASPSLCLLLCKMDLLIAPTRESRDGQHVTRNTKQLPSAMS